MGFSATSLPWTEEADLHLGARLQIPSDEPSFVNGLTARGAELQCRAVVLVLLSRAQQRTQSKKKIMLTNTEPEVNNTEKWT